MTTFWKNSVPAVYRARRERYVDLYAQLLASNTMTLVRWWFQYESEISMEEVQQIMVNNMKEGIFGAFRQTVDGIPGNPRKIINAGRFRNFYGAARRFVG